MVLRIIVAIACLFSVQVQADVPDSVGEAFLEAGGNPKALNHLKCFYQRYSRKTFNARRSRQIPSRCNYLEGGQRQISINDFDSAVIVDYTKTSNHRRFYLLDLAQSSNNLVQAHYVSHGRNGNTPRSNTTPGPGRNTIREITYYNNTPGSNASAAGFHITGMKYRGQWSGPDRRRNSMVVHGIEKNRNDNACDRAIVMHGNEYIKESGSNEGVNRMSSGCFMLDYGLVNQMVDKLRGTGGTFHPREVRRGGVVFFVYGPDQAELPDDYYCRESSEADFRL